MIKIFIIFAICLLSFVTFTKSIYTNSSLELEETIQKLVEKCRVSVGGTVNDMMDALYDNTAKSKEGQCLQKCVMNELNLLDSTGNLVESEVLKYIRQLTDGNLDLFNIGMKIFDKCSAKKRTNIECGDVEVFTACIKEEGGSIIPNQCGC